MNMLRPATLPWLLRHELRLWWRELRSRPGALAWAIAFGALSLFIFLWLWLLLSGLRGLLWAAKSGELAAWNGVGEVLDLAGIVVFWLAAGGWLLGFCYALIQSINQSVVALFDRGDLDLLVSSPVSGKVIFASRLLGVAIAVFLNFAPVVALICMVSISLGFPQVLGILPALAGMSVTAASLAMLLTLWLVRWLGVRQARTVAQLLAVLLTSALLTAAFFLLSQLHNLLRSIMVDAGTLRHWQSWFGRGGLLGPGSLLGPDSFTWFPVRAMFFDLGALLLTLLVSGILAWLTVATLHRTFASGTQQAVTGKHRRKVRETYFSGSFYQVALLKEWRIIFRNPYLISAIFLPILLLIPALVTSVRGNGSILSQLVTIISIGIGESLTHALVRVCVSGEEAPDLLKASPMPAAKLRRFKLLAALIPVWLLLSPLFLILIHRRQAWFLPLAVCLAATICAAILRLWNSRPVALTDLFKRRQQRNTQADLLLSVLEMMSLFTWVLLGIAVNQGAIISIVILSGVEALLVAIAYWRSRQLGTSLGF